MPYYQKKKTFTRYSRRPVRGTGSYHVPKSSGYRASSRAVVSYRRNLRGRGAYTYSNPGPYGMLGRRYGAEIGRRYGGPIGEWAGEKIGGLLHYPARLFGSGSYGLTDASETTLAPTPPTFAKEGDFITVTHREYLGDIVSSATPGAFKIDTFALNPAESNTFPWLSNIAQPNFQQYQFSGLVFEYKSFSADALNSTNTALGSVFAAINYDATDPDFESRAQIENTDWSMSAKPSESFLIPVECKPSLSTSNGLLYVVNGNTIPSGTDAKTYYLGKLTIATTGFQGASVNCGSLYVTYKVKLLKALMTEPLSNGAIVSYDRSSADGTNRFGTATISNSYNCDTIGVTFTSGNVITLSKKRLQVGASFIMILSWLGNSTASVVEPTVAMSSGLYGERFFGGNAANYTLASTAAPTPANTSASLVYVVKFGVSSNLADQTITLSAGTFPSSSVLNLRIVQITGTDMDRIGFYTP